MKSGKFFLRVHCLLTVLASVSLSMSGSHSGYPSYTRSQLCDDCRSDRLSEASVNCCFVRVSPCALRVSPNTLALHWSTDVIARDGRVLRLICCKKQLLREYNTANTSASSITCIDKYVSSALQCNFELPKTAIRANTIAGYSIKHTYKHIYYTSNLVTLRTIYRRCIFNCVCVCFCVSVAVCIFCVNIVRF